MIKAVYVINRDGVPLYYREDTEEENIARVTLFSGVISAIQYLLKDLQIGSATEVSTKSNDILLELATEFAVIVVLDQCSQEEKTNLRKELAKLVTTLVFHSNDVKKANFDENSKAKIDKIVDEAIKSFEEALHTSKATRKMKEMLW